MKQAPKRSQNQSPAAVRRKQMKLANIPIITGIQSGSSITMTSSGQSVYSSSQSGRPPTTYTLVTSGIKTATSTGSSSSSTQASTSTGHSRQGSGSRTSLDSGQSLAQLQQLGNASASSSHSSLLHGLSFNIQGSQLKETSGSGMKVLEGILSSKQSFTQALASADSSSTKTGPSTAGRGSNTSTVSASSYSGKTSSVHFSVSTNSDVKTSSLAMQLPHLISTALKAAQSAPAKSTCVTLVTTKTPPVTAKSAGVKSSAPTSAVSGSKMPAVSGSKASAVSGSKASRVSKDVSMLGLIGAQHVTISSKKKILDEERDAQVQAIQKLQFHDFPLTTASLMTTQSQVFT